MAGFIGALQTDGGGCFMGAHPTDPDHYYFDLCLWENRESILGRCALSYPGLLWDASLAVFASAISRNVAIVWSPVPTFISKVYFPRLIIPASSVITCFVDFLISVVIFIGLAIWYHFVPSGNVVFLPLFILLVIALSLGAGVWMAALMVEYPRRALHYPFCRPIRAFHFIGGNA